MSVFEASADAPFPSDADVIGRLRDLITRKVGPVEEQIDAALHRLSGAVQRGLSPAAIRLGIDAVRDWVRQRTPARELSELEALLARVRAAPGPEIERYDVYLFAVSTEF